MSVKPLVNATKAVYLLASGEPLLTRDWLDDTCCALRAAGFVDIAKLQVDVGFDWQQMLSDSSTMSLFSDKKCRILTLLGKPGTQGSKAIADLCQNPPVGDLFIFITGSLDRQSKSSSWLKAIQAAGEVIEIKPVYENQLAAWIEQRAQNKGLVIDRQAAQFLAERTEGNLLAADQELEKLALRLGPQQKLEFAMIEASVAQSARYSHFLLVEACLAGDAARALKILSSLRAEGYASTQLRWALQTGLEQLDRLKHAQRGGSVDDRLWQQLQIWRNKQRLYQTALKRLQSAEIELLLQSCATVDRLGKGQQDPDFPEQEWLQLRLLVVGFCGQKINRYEPSLI